MTAEHPDAAPARLRGHHFVCLQFFRGEGYSPAFVENLSRVVEHVTNVPAVVAGGADDVCARCPGLAPDGTCLDPQAGELEVRRLDRLACEVLGVQPGSRLSLAEARARLVADREAIARWHIEACTGCTWERVCEAGWDEL